MKKSILAFGIALLGFSSIATANTNGDNIIKLPPSTEEAVMAPAHISGDQAKCIEELINENNEITESTVVLEESSLVDPTIDELIAEDNKIIESNFKDVVYPLDFKKINRKLTMIRMVQPKHNFVGQL